MSEPCSPSSSTSSTCHCINFCYCGLGEYGEIEGSYGLGSTISWQHFPPSTSTRSRCGDSSMEERQLPSIPESSCTMAEEAEGEGPCSTISSTKYPILKSISQLNAEHYLHVRHIFEFYKFLIGHLVCAEPDDPIAYLSEILERCLSYRDCYGEIPLLVTNRHLKSLYDTFDPYGNGSITVDQYDTAMDNIGIAKSITQYCKNPPVDRQGMVSEKFFMEEGMRCLIGNLKKMIRIPKDWEENRRVWRKVMIRRLERCHKSFYPCPPYSPEEQSEEDASSTSTCKCGIVKEAVCPGVCPCPPRMRYEPEQLFLNA